MTELSCASIELAFSFYYLKKQLKYPSVYLTCEKHSNIKKFNVTFCFAHYNVCLLRAVTWLTQNLLLLALHPAQDFLFLLFTRASALSCCRLARLASSLAWLVGIYHKLYFL